MRRLVKAILKLIVGIIGIVLIVTVIFSVYVWKNSQFEEPKVSQHNVALLNRQKLNDSTFTIGKNWLRKNEFGLYEMFTAGSPYQRGLINGKLSQELVISQEEVFTTQIKKLVPSQSYLKFLKYVVGFMNRDLPDHVTDEYKQEIYGISQSASAKFDWIGTNYNRQLNYHAAHDIGHALQNLMLVGCTSFGAWDAKTENGAMLLGRNFDFYMGDDFAKNKIVSFVAPDKGHKFAFVTWGGFIGVVSGMNDQGLTVTINAAKSAIPYRAATPVSLVAREILQYAGNIKEAIAIAHRRKMFVSESFLIGSAKDHKSIVIEKTPDTLAIYDAQSNEITCANHYQSALFQQQDLNKEQMGESASVYRFNRTNELLQSNYPLNPQKVANILRNTNGIGNKNIGLGNEKAVNQLLAHHSIIFMPDSLRMWVSTSPWQLGTFVCYDLKKVFAMEGLHGSETVAHQSLNIAPDSFLQTQSYQHFLQFKQAKLLFMDKQSVDPEIVIRNNPEYYDAYRIAGDIYSEQKRYSQATSAYQTALTKEIATQKERDNILEKINKLKKLNTAKAVKQGG